jgi:hypothetical protein
MLIATCVALCFHSDALIDRLLIEMLVIGTKKDPLITTVLTSVAQPCVIDVIEDV